MNPNLHYTEQELVFQLKKQDRTAFEYLYEKYSKALLTVVYQIVGETETSNDVLQQVFVSIWQKAERYDPSKGRLFTWMLNIARNAAIDYLRSKANKNQKKNREIDNNVYTDNLTTDAIVHIDGIGLTKFIDSLKQEYKMVLLQSYYQGYTHEEIAENLNIPVGTVKTRIRASLIELRKKMMEN